MTLEAIPIGTLVPGGLKNTGQVCGKDQTNCNAWLSRLGIERWVNDSSPQKKHTITETRDTFQDSSLAEKCEGFTGNGARIGEVVWLLVIGFVSTFDRKKSKKVQVKI